MQKILLLSFFLIGFSFLSCKSTKNTESTTKIPDDFSFSMTRTGCHGQCPIYAYNIQADGTVYYEGEAFVKNIGRFQKTLAPTVLKEIIEALKVADYWTLNEVYDEANIMDLPATKTSCKMNGKTHSVLNRFDGPAQLVALEKKIDELVGQDGFTPVKK